MKGLRPVKRGMPQSRMETMLIDQAVIKKWRIPPFQRPLTINKRVLQVVEDLKEAETPALSGTITIGILKSGPDKGVWFIADGQHRIKAYEMSEVPQCLIDLRLVEFEDMAHMAEHYSELNDPLVTMKPDDKLKALEESNPGLQLIRKRCPWVGYRAGGGSIVSMSVVLRAWFGSQNEVVSNPGRVLDLVKALLDTAEAERIATFLNAVAAAWGGEEEYRLLWRSLNLCMVAWLWRRTVLAQYSQRSVRLTRDQFTKCCMSLSANKSYVDWLVGRTMGDRDKGPCYARIKSTFATRLVHEGLVKPMLPQPEWATGQKHAMFTASLT